MHTPGPWKSGGCVVWLENGTRICDMAMTTLEIGAGDVEANARLIAAAPDLLEACKTLLADFDSDSNGLVSRIGRLERAAVLRAAITKAEGR